MVTDAESQAWLDGRLSLRADIRALMRGESVPSEIARDLVREVIDWGLNQVDHQEYLAPILEALPPMETLPHD